MATRTCWHFNCYIISYIDRVKRSIMVELIRLIVCPIQHESLEFGWQLGLVGTTTAAHHLLHRQSRMIHHR
eukprot:scaffold28886_cov68-Skeletonema_marinoi.AAC.1